MDEFDKFMKSLENVGILTGWSDFINENNTDKCKDCVWYHQENETCNAKKCSGYGSGFVTKQDRKHCTQQKQK